MTTTNPPTSPAAGGPSVRRARAGDRLTEEQTKIRRLFRSEETDVVAMESTSRTFRGLSALLIRLRDRPPDPVVQRPIRHGDHVSPCVRAVNHDETIRDSARLATGSRSARAGDIAPCPARWDRHEVEMTTPSGQILCSRAPRPPQPPPQPGGVEIRPGPGRWPLSTTDTLRAEQPPERRDPIGVGGAPRDRFVESASGPSSPWCSPAGSPRSSRRGPGTPRSGPRARRGPGRTTGCPACR